MPSFYPEGNTVLASDDELRTLHKIASLQASGGSGSSDFTYTRSAANPVAAPSTTNAQHYNTATQVLWQWDGAAWV